MRRLTLSRGGRTLPSRVATACCIGCRHPAPASLGDPLADATTPAPPTLTPDAALPALATLVRERMLDAELAATTWVLIEGGVPLIVAGPRPVARRLLDALLEGVAP